MYELGVQPTSWYTSDDFDTATESGSLLLGLGVGYKHNKNIENSLHLLFEGHSKPIPLTSAVALKTIFKFKNDEVNTPGISVLVGKGLNGNIGNGNNGLYLGLDFFYFTLNRKENRTYFNLGYSRQGSPNLRYNGDRIDAITNSIKLSVGFTIFLSTTVN